MNRSILIVAVASFFSVSAIFAQPVSFSNPVSWMTQRNDTIFLRAQLDTALIKKKTISVSLFKVNDGKKSVVAKKSLKITDNVMELFFEKIGKDLLGGKDFLRLEWSLPDSGEKGVIEPIGVLNLQKIQKNDTLKAFRVEKGASSGTISALMKPDQFKKLGPVEFSTAWNMDALFIVLKKSQDSSTINFSFDCKNGKNAFLSYPDRIISYKPSNDSLRTSHYTREIKSDSLKYIEKTWQCDVTKETIGDKVVIRMPWADAGVIPFEERMVGFGMFVFQNNGKVIASIPEKALPLVPGTWTDIFLQK